MTEKDNPQPFTAIMLLISFAVAVMGKDGHALAGAIVFAALVWSIEHTSASSER